MPGRPPLLVAPPAPSGRSLAYPADGSIVALSSIHLTTKRCSTGVAIRRLMLFSRAVTADRVDFVLERGRTQTSSVRGLRVGRRGLAASAARTRIGDWAMLSVGGARSALVIRLLNRRSGLPARTVVRVAFATRHAAAVRRVTFARAEATALRSAKAKTNRQAPRRASRPLTITPPLGPDDYVFPVAGRASFGDSYGGFRADVSGNWHHGDDIFASLGTPVVAAAGGTLHRVGWETLGGWRLWIRDRHRNEFYYAHLSGYSPLALQAKRVRAGDVLGFVGNTGDAFTTPPHLHFEIHPHQLLHLHYDGAVDPTGYLERWRHVEHVHAPKPLLARLPDGEAAQEARYVFAELRTARGLTHRRAGRPPHIRLPALDRAFSSVEPVPTKRAASPLPLILISIASAIGVTGCGAAAVARRRRG